MRAIISFTLMLLVFNIATAEENNLWPICDGLANSSPARLALYTLSQNGYLSNNEVDKHEETAIQKRRNENIILKTIGLKKIGPIQFYSILLPPQGPWPFDEQTPSDNLYQMVQYMKIKNAEGKVFEFVIISSVADSECGISTPLVIETSPQYRVVGKWEDYLQVWERYRNREKGYRDREKGITPNLVAAEKDDFKPVCDAVNFSPAKSALFTLSRNAYLESNEVMQFLNDAARKHKNENIALKMIGYKKIGQILFYPLLLSAKGSWPIDSQNPDDNLYQMVQHMKIKNEAGKIFEYVVVGSVADHDCDISTALVIETSPQHRVIGKWEDYLQLWERYRSGEKSITPNLVK